MCIKQHKEKQYSSSSYHAAKKLSLELKEFARKEGLKQHITVKDKYNIIKAGFSKADAQLIWEEGPTDWATNLTMLDEHNDVYCVAENGFTLSFYDK